MALPNSSRNGAKVIWIALHTAEGSRNKEDLYAFFNRGQHASSHVGIDGRGVADWVDRSRSAWTLLNGNPISVNAEICGFAKWTRAQWLSTGTVDGCYNPRQIVRNVAWWVLRESRALGIPLEYIGTGGVRSRRSGIIMHWDYSKGTGNGDHWDIGREFPFDVMFQDIRELQGVAAPATPEPKKVGTEMDFLVKGDKRPEVYVVSSTSAGFEKRHIEIGEYNTLTGCGATVTTRPQAEVDAIARYEDGRNVIGRSVHNYEVPNGPDSYVPSYATVEETIQTLRSIAESLKSHIENPPASS